MQKDEDEDNNNINNNNFNSITIDELGKKYKLGEEEEDFDGIMGGYNDDQTYMANKGGINNLLFGNEEKNNNKEEKTNGKRYRKT